MAKNHIEIIDKIGVNFVIVNSFVEYKLTPKMAKSQIEIIDKIGVNFVIVNIFLFVQAHKYGYVPFPLFM